MEIEEIKFNDKLSVYKTKYDWEYTKEQIINKIDKNSLIVDLTDVNTTTIVLNCEEFNSINRQFLNVALSLSHIQNWNGDWLGKMWVYRQLKTSTMDSWHTHKFAVDVPNSKKQIQIPNEWSCCLYLQMPPDVTGDEGKLMFRDKDGNEFSLLPEEGDIIFFASDVPHRPVLTPNSDIERITLCVNISFKAPIVKTVKTIL
jgi:hypothetical protein